MAACDGLADAVFLSTLSLRRATICVCCRQQGRRNFYPRSPCGERRKPCCPAGTGMHFYPRSPCGERLFKGDHGHISGDISIHALLAESDDLQTLQQYRFVISIHALLAESDSKSDTATAFPLSFLSTLSLRRAT